MEIKELIKELLEKEIVLWSDGDSLKYKAPKGVVTEKIKKTLKENKAELLQYLNGHKEIAFVSYNDSRYEKFSLTDIQNSYVVGRNNLYELGGVACHGYLEVVFDEIIDVGKLEIAWNKVIQKHDMLRAIIYDVGYQIIQESVPNVSIKVVDLRDNLEVNYQERENLRETLSNKQYNLGKWPMCDVAVSIDNNKSIIHFSVDMLIADFKSMNIILNDLEEFYRNQEAEIKTLSLYRDVLLYQNNLKLTNNKIRNKDEIYWDKKIPTMGGSPKIPIIKKTGFSDYKFFQKMMFLDSTEWKKLCGIASNNNITPSVLVMSVLAEVIALWSSDEKFCINTTFFNRPNVVDDINMIVGDFTDINVTSINLDFHLSFLKRTQALQENLWLDLEHNSISGVEILRKLTKERKKNIIIPVVFTSTAGIANKNDTTVKRRIEYKISQTPQVYIDCQLSDENGGAKINWDIREGVFEDSIINDMFNSFSELIVSICMNSEEVFLENYPVKLPRRTIEIREKLNNMKKEFSYQMMEEGFLNSLKIYPDKTAIITEAGEFTYRSLSKYILSIMNVLKEKGIKSEDRIGINIDKNEWQIASVIATLLLKATYVPIDVKQPMIRKRKIISKAEIKVILSQDEDFSIVQDCENINVMNLKLCNNELDIINVEKDYNRPAYIIFTSGTTGEPKGVIITHKAAMNTIIDVNEKYNISESDIFLGLANLSFDLSVYDIFGCFLAGGTLVLPNSNNIKDPKYLYDLVLLHRISIWNSVPAQMQMMINYLESVDNIRKSACLKTILLSGDWIPTSLPKRIYALFTNAKVVSMGGATEASIWSIFYNIKKDDVFIKSVPYGIPMTNQKFYVFNNHLEHCPDGVDGNLYIAGDGLSLGYLNDEVLNSEKYSILPRTDERIYRTGDKGSYRNDGVIIFKGRESGDEQVKIHGHRIELSEIRSVLMQNPLIDSAVTLTLGMPPEELKIVAAVSPKRKSNIKKISDDNQEINMLTSIGEEYEKNIDASLLETWIRESELVVVSDIYNVFKKYDIFTSYNKFYTFDEIVGVMNIPEKLHKLTKRWMRVLIKEGIIKENNNQYVFIKNQHNLNSNDLWENFYRTEEKFNYSKEFMDYLKKSSDLLIDMIQGKENPLNLLFPKGDVKPAMAAYHDNKINKMHNDIAINEILYLCNKYNKKNPSKTFRILEVGAGVGGTSIDLIPELENYNVEYHFTDLSTFFLNKAQENFEKYAWMKYGIFDVNKDFVLQGYEAFSFDLILCANVLHNAKDIHDVMENLKGLLKNEGNMIILEETRISYMLLTSMEFKDGLTGFLDERKEDDQTFFTRKQWEGIFEKHNANIVYEFPKRDSKLDLSGQTIYITKFLSDYENIDTYKVKRYLENTISSYMIPNNIIVLPEMPLTENKKIDMGKIRLLFETNSSSVIKEKEMPKTDLEKRISEIWSRELNIKSIGRDDDFYSIGGDSLLIAQVVGKIVEEVEEAKEWEWGALLAEMVQTPTIRDIATKINRYQDEKDSFVDPSLIQIKNSNFTNEKSVAKVLFHAGTGTLSAYTNLASYVEKDSKENESILGFSFGNEAEYVSMEIKYTFKLLGEKYGKILKQLGYSNYILIGHCVGGPIALETAQYLRKYGISVSDVTLISATIPKKKDKTIFRELPDEFYNRALKSSLENELLLERTFAKLINANEAKAGYTTGEKRLAECIEYIVRKGNGEVTSEALCNLGGEYEDVAEEFCRLSKKPISERLNILYGTIERADMKLMEHELKMLNTLFNIFTQNFGCVASYEPEPYDGNIRLFACEEKGANFYPGFFDEDYETWKPYIKGDYRYEIIAGQHFDCIVEPNLNKNICNILDFSY